MVAGQAIPQDAKKTQRSAFKRCMATVTTHTNADASADTGQTSFIANNTARWHTKEAKEWLDD